MKITERKGLVFGNYIVKVEARGASCREIKNFIATQKITCGRSDKFMQFAGTDIGQSYADVQFFHIWGDTDEFRLKEGLVSDQRVEGTSAKSEPPYRLLYAPSMRDEPLSMDDEYDGGWIFCSAR